MTLITPDFTDVPIWRREPKRLEAPISAYRFWYPAKESGEWYLYSVAASFRWDGPAATADVKPYDIELYDKHKKELYDGGALSPGLQSILHKTWTVGGIHSIRFLPAAKSHAEGYGAGIFGVIDLWGRVAQFTIGYRSERCVIRKLYIVKSILDEEFALNGYGDQDFLDMKRDFERRYDCEVEIVANFSAIS